MRRILVIITLLCVVCGLVVNADAATGAQSIVSSATVATDGSCQVTLIVAIHLDQPVEDLQFPLPKDAEKVTVNGSRAHSRVENGLQQVALSGILGNAAGDFTLTFVYSLPDVIATNEAGLLELQLPMLSGFAYPVQSLEFSVNLPGPVNAKPAFSSGYHQANIEKDISWTVSGTTVTGIAQVALKDHETLSMQLLVSQDLFPQNGLTVRDFRAVSILLTVFSLLTLVYWVFFLRNLPRWPIPSPTPPDGCNAGELGSVLHLQGGNLNAMVFSWAQLGYLRIRLEHSGRILLCRQMDMGNERSAYEQRCFKLLFGRHNTVDIRSMRYAESYRNVQKMKPNLSALIRQKSGNLFIFRTLAAIAGLFCGVSVGLDLYANSEPQWFLVVLLGILAFLSSFGIQRWALALYSPDKQRFWVAASLCGAWLLLGGLAGQLSATSCFVLGQLLCGLLAAFGGRRTPAGKQAMAEVMGLGQYLKTVSPEQLRLICHNNPEYFHQMMPYALALGVDDRFAKRFAKLPVGACPYISIGADSPMRASQWRGLMRRILKAMNTRQKRSLLQRLAGLFRSF